MKSFLCVRILMLILSCHVYAIDFVTYTNQSCEQINWSLIIATDWEYLWVLSNNKFDTESISNKFWDYGNRFDSLSIFNRFWDYGNRFDSLSPRNRFSQDGPLLIKDEDVIWVLTANKWVNWSIDPLWAILCFIDFSDDRLEPFIELYDIWWNSTPLISPTYFWWIADSYKSCWLNSSLNWEGQCVCNKWYVRMNANSNNYDCRLKTELELCQDDFWSNATYSEESEKCVCKIWYQTSSDKKYCEPIPAPIVTKTPTQMCQTDFWVNSYSDWSEHVNWWYNCYCNTWYQRNNNQTSCLKFTPQNELSQSITWLYDNWLTMFNTTSTFMATKEITREQASKFFVELAKNYTAQIPNTGKQVNFTDIEKADKTLKWYIIEAFQMNIFQGTNGKFLPFNNLTKAQALAVVTRVIFWNQYEWRISGTPRYQKYRDIANENSILNNLWFSFATLDNENITRGDMAIIIHRYTNRHVSNNPLYCESDVARFSCIIEEDCPIFCEE